MLPADRHESWCSVRPFGTRECRRVCPRLAPELAPKTPKPGLNDRALTRHSWLSKAERGGFEPPVPFARHNGAAPWLDDPGRLILSLGRWRIAVCSWTCSGRWPSWSRCPARDTRLPWHSGGQVLLAGAELIRTSGQSSFHCSVAKFDSTEIIRLRYRLLARSPEHLRLVH